MSDRDNPEMTEALGNRAGTLRDHAALLDLAYDSIFVRDMNGRILFWNHGAEETYGWSKAEAIERITHALLATEFPKPLEQIEADLLENGRWEGELVHRKRDGTHIVVASRWTLQRDAQGTPVEILEISNDITARKLVEQTLREVEKRDRAVIDTAHEASIWRQRAELARANFELTAANKELEAFSYSVAHDLRAPLRHIDGFSRILLEEYGPDLKPNAQHCLERIQQGVHQMGRLVDDLLNLGRVGRQTLHRRPTSLKSLVLDVLGDLKPGTKGRNLEWHIDDLPVVECDPGLMKLVFVNLLSNAIKFTGPQKVAEIHVGQMTQNGELVIFVRDNGVGFNMRYVHKLFGIFQRLHPQEDFEGTGVGLANVQRIVHKHGGRVWAEAEPCKGATFYFTMAAPKESEPKSERDVTLRGGACQRAE